MHCRLELFSQLLCQNTMSGLWKAMREAQVVPGGLGGKSSLEYGNKHESNYLFRRSPFPHEVHLAVHRTVGAEDLSSSNGSSGCIPS